MQQLKIYITDGANQIIHELQDNGYEAFLCGGAVRDSILNRKVHDWDITTSATPDEMLEIFKDEKIIETGLQHGTVTIVIDDISYEVTTYRVDGDYSDNRRPDSVTFTKSLEEDLKRRDFTINAMAYNDEVGLVDPFDGMGDLKHHIIKCVGNPEDRFNEDALRILRAIRFAAQLEFYIDRDTKSAIRKLKENLKNISVERINSEFCKIAKTEHFGMITTFSDEVFSVFIPEIKDTFGFEQNNPYHDYDVWGHTIMALVNCTSEDLILKLAVFFHDIGKPHCYQDGEDSIRHFKGHGRVSSDMANKIMKRLRFDNETREKVIELVYYHDATFEIGEKYIKRWLNKIGEEQFRRLLKLRRCDIMAQNSKYRVERIKKIDQIEVLLEKVLSEECCFTLKDLAVNGNDLIAIGYKPGKELGEKLNYLLQLVIDGECINEKDELLKHVQYTKSCNWRTNYEQK